MKEKVLQKYFKMLNNTQILDKEKIINSTSKVKTIFRRFVSEISKDIGEMKHAAKENNWEKLIRISHKFQGTAGNCGFPMLMKKAFELQENIRAGKTNNLLTTELKNLETLGNISVLEFERLLPQEI